MAPDALQQGVGADQIRVNEGRGIVERVVIVRLSGVVHEHTVTFGQVSAQAVDQLSIGDIAFDQLDPVGRQALERTPITGVSEQVEDLDLRVGIGHQMAYEIGADESSAPGDEK